MHALDLYSGLHSLVAALSLFLLLLQRCRVKMTPKEVEFRLLKKVCKYTVLSFSRLIAVHVHVHALPLSTPSCAANKWPRLQASQGRPHWIRLDFDLFEGQEESEEEEEDEKRKEVANPEKMAQMVCVHV